MPLSIKAGGNHSYSTRIISKPVSVTDLWWSRSYYSMVIYINVQYHRNHHNVLSINLTLWNLKLPWHLCIRTAATPDEHLGVQVHLSTFLPIQLALQILSMNCKAVGTDLQCQNFHLPCLSVPYFSHDNSSESQFMDRGDSNSIRSKHGRVF